MRRLIHGIPHLQTGDVGPLRGLFEELAEGRQPETRGQLARARLGERARLAAG